MTCAGWCALGCAALAGLLGWRPLRHPGLARVDARASTPVLRAGVRRPRGSPREVARRRASVLALAERLAAELQGGAEPRAALSGAARASPGLAALAAAAELPSGDVAATLRALGCDGARDLALLWEVGESSGAGLAAPAGRLAAALRDDEQVRREVAAQLAGPRATAWLLAGLPLFGLAMGAALGARPVDVLSSRFGLALVVPGLVLEALGLLWTRAIARRVMVG
jgi:tight adherence protein B